MSTVYTILGSPAVVLSRVTSEETGEPIEQADVESITFTITDLSTELPVSGWADVTGVVSDIVLDTPVTSEEDGRWDGQEGYNWSHEIDADAFPTGNNYYALVYTIDTVVGEPIEMPPIYIRVLDPIADADSYARRYDIERVFGGNNVAKWADVDNREDVYHIQDRITWALEQAKARMDDRLRAGPYEVPWSTPYPLTLIDCCARLAGILLYDSRGAQDIDQETGQAIDNLQVHRRYVDQYLRDVLASKMRPGARSTLTTHPEVYDG